MGQSSGPRRPAISSPPLCQQEKQAIASKSRKWTDLLGGAEGNWRIAAVGVALFSATPGGRASTCLDHGEKPDRLHAGRQGCGWWFTTGCFDEMYSSFATQGLADPGKLVKREQFAPLAKENAGSLAEIGYFTTLKIAGKAAGVRLGDGLLDGGAARPSGRVPRHPAAQEPDRSQQVPDAEVADRNISSISNSTTRIR